MSALTPHVRVMRAVAAALVSAAKRLEREDQALEAGLGGKPSKRPLKAPMR